MMSIPELLATLPAFMLLTSFVLIIVAAISILIAKGLTLQDRLLWLLVVTVFNVVGIVVWVVYSKRRREDGEEHRPAGHA